MSKHILIAGGGPVGLMTAFLAAERGMQVTLVERDPKISRQLRASTFHPPTLDMLEPLGLTKTLLANGRITPRWQIRIHETGERATFDLSVLCDVTAHPYRLQVEQWRLSEALFERLQTSDGVSLRFGETIEAAGEDQGVWLRTDQGEIRGDFLIGCDGAKSTVRQAMGATFDGSTYPETTMLLTTHFDFDEVFEGLAGVNYIWREDGTYSLLHLPDLWRVSINPEGADWDEADIKRQLAAIVPKPVEIIEMRPYRVHQRLASTYRRGHMLLAGDAAHLNNPKGGMGLNGGIHDAFAVVEAIDDGGELALNRYSSVRRTVAEEDIIKQADANQARMNETDSASRLGKIRHLQAIANDPERARGFLLHSSMIEGLRRAEAMG